MTYMKNVDSVPDPRKNPVKKEAVNPERFEKALKVEKNDATDKREKRNRPKKAEEAEDEVDVSAAIPVPKGLFKEYMKEDEKGDTVLDVEGGKSAHLVSDDPSSMAPAPEEGYIAEDDGSTSKISVGVSQNAPPPPPAPEDSSDDYDTSPPEEAAPPPAATTDQPSQTFQQPQSSFTPETPSIEEDDEPKQTEKTSEPQKTSSDKKKTSDTKKKKKKKKTTEVKKKKTTTTAPKKDVKAQAPKVQAPKVQAPKDPSKGFEEVKAPKDETETKESTAPKQATKGKVEEKETTPTPKDSKDVAPTQVEGLDDKQDTKDKDHGSEQGSDEATVGQTAAPASTAGIEQLQLSPFANMPKDVFELFEKMVGLMTMQKDDGKTTITVTLNMKGSPFNECQVVLEHYDTAPHAFNVQFLGNPEGVEKFAKNMQGLNSAIAQSKLTFSINLLPPKLTKNYAGRIEGTDNDADTDEKKDGEKKQQ